MMAKLLGYALRANPTYRARVFSLYASLNKSDRLLAVFEIWRPART